MKNWYLVYTKPRSEDRVAQRFTDAAIEVLNPKLKERRYVRGRLQDVISPLFPCYIFVRFDFQGEYRIVKYTRGVRRIVGTDYAPTVLPQEMIDSIRCRMDGGLVKIIPSRFKTGEEVRIKYGPLEGLDAVFEKELKGIERVSILLKTINAHVIVDSASLARIG